MRRRVALAAVGAAVVFLLAGAAARAAWSRGAIGESGRQVRLPPATAAVTRTTLVETKTVSGTLGYGEEVPVDAAGQGTLTWIAAVGSTVKRGEALFKLDERAVVALYGSVPLYRTLRPGLAGADIRQLEENLAALGYTGFTVDTDYTAATAAAVRAWQTSLGLATTGTVERGQVVFTPGPVRVARHAARIGATTGRSDGGETVLSYTGTTRQVTIDLKVADQALAVVGGKVTVTIPGGRSVDGTVAAVGTVAAAPEPTPGTSGPSGPTTSDARIPVTVELADQQALGTLEGAPVDVDLVSRRREGVLAVPVAALLALPEGGYGVEIVDGRSTRIVPVQTGLFAAGRVEISGGGIEEGMKVGVPR
jgi:peptidoglycan hydrolase-like protein with peptidoglycan-binding domain